MKIRFCEFCSKVVQEDAEYCDICGCRLGQDVEEEIFNDAGNRWPFQPVNEITLRIQGQPRQICFDGTHSLFHFWTELYRAYSDRNLWFRERSREEMELVSFPEGHAREGFRLLDSSDILNCGHRRFSVFTCTRPDPELTVEPDAMEITYQASFHLPDCPDMDIPYVLGWLLATAPLPGYKSSWVYHI